MVESFAPTVLVNKQIITPPGWMWILAFAMNGCEWAIRECDTEKFKNKMHQWQKDNKVQHLESTI